MTPMKRPRLKAVRPLLGASLSLTFTNGQHFILNMSDVLEAYPGLALLSKQEAFEGAVLGNGGWFVEWPALDIQIGADTLLLDALAQVVPDENLSSSTGAGGIGLTLSKLPRFLKRAL